MLAQGQPSSAKKGGLAAVSSGLIFLKKKKKNLEIVYTIKRRRGIQLTMNQYPKLGTVLVACSRMLENADEQ